MSTKITLKNTSISFTASSRKRSIKIGFPSSKDKDTWSLYFIPSFSGNGWETSLMPRLEHKYCKQHAVQITFTWIKKLFSKMQNSRQEGGANSWTSAIARMFL